MGVFSIGLSGLNAAQAGLVTTSHNISNAGTEGYTRQRTVQEAQEPFFSGGGFLGTGTKITTTLRQYDQFINKQLLDAQARSSELDTYEQQIAQLDDLLADPDAGLSPALQDFFRAVQDLSANPTSSAARQSTISAGEALASRFQLLDGRMNEIRGDINSQVIGHVSSINSYAQGIAEINKRIQGAESAGPGQPANDLRDQRDQLITELNRIIKVSTVQQSDGAISVFIGNGQSLVVGNIPFQLAAVPDPADPQRMTLGQVLGGGGTVAIPESMFSGGELGGLLAFRSESLDDAQTALGQLAMDFANGFNAQHRLGQTLDGNPGGDFFGFAGTPTALTAASQIRVTIADTRDVAAASPVATAASSANTGTAKVDGGRVLNLASLPFGSPVSLTYDSGTNSFNATGGVTAGPFAYTAGQPFSVGGVEVTITGTPANGDVFTLGNNANGRNDNRNALQLGSLQTASLALGGTASLQSAYASLVSDVGSRSREVQITARAATTLVEQTTATQQGISGVNLDEEAANLLRYQQLYQANSKVIQIAGKIFDEILALGR
ncbi:MAG TPA: flagellar hook-associated protein FlgK [Rhodocyclaceae bacterium]|nr:flagellar hook-associated protein FlgK [Rhodocyclaceae bacterium]HMZ82972.1 flagellar hook-associated protein FlgK [Rhodocyclaceae bacterium]HNA03060.1 flagellar hook-associated protein FlgK [Rhodocyclaceae bacterium]HNB76944.1 flagellar hook-associated protein FlgK [Rhodocyclaceae bacterium]HNC60734.1 flagellar hook-associated protein FlgK [Rhodocyclaceae bacterium]